jgi:multidrug efflux system outer membrane protein
MRKRLLVTLVCGLLAACNFAPPYRQPDLPIAEHFDAFPTASLEEAQLAKEVDWETFFADPQLKLLISTALQRNRDLVASTARIEQARAFYRIQNAARLPQVNVNGSATRTKAPLGSIDPEFDNTDISVQFNQYNVQAAVASFELDFWGRVRNLSESARRQYLATVEAQRAFRLSLIGNVAATYYAIRSGDEGIALAERTVASRQYALDVAKLRLDAGVTSSVDYEQAAILVTQAQTQLAELQRTTAQQRNQLTVLIGGPLESVLPDASSIADAAQFGALDPGLPSALLVNRPDILQAEQQLRSADADIGAARADFFPRISLTGSFGYVYRANRHGRWARLSACRFSTLVNGRLNSPRHVQGTTNWWRPISAPCKRPFAKYRMRWSDGNAIRNRLPRRNMPSKHSAYSRRPPSFAMKTASRSIWKWWMHAAVFLPPNSN